MEIEVNMILVTGATGFLGRHLLAVFSKKKIKAACLIRRVKSRGKIRGFKPVIGNLNEPESLYKATKNIDVVIHIAGEVNPKDNMLYNKINYLGTVNLVNACRKNKVKRIIYLSSLDAALKTAYGRSKSKAEKIIKRSGIDHVILRPSLIYGEGDNKHLADIARTIKRSPFIPVFGDGRYLRQPVYVRDVAESILKAVKLKKKNKTYNIGGPDKLEFDAMMDMIAESLGLKRIKIHIPFSIGRFFVGLYERIMPNPGFTVEQMDSLRMDKVFDISDSVRDLGLKPKRFKDMAYTIANSS